MLRQGRKLPNGEKRRDQTRKHRQEGEYDTQDHHAVNREMTQNPSRKLHCLSISLLELFYNS